MNPLSIPNMDVGITFQASNMMFSIGVDLLCSCLLFLDSQSLIRWSATWKGSKYIFVSSSHAKHHLQRLILELHISKDNLERLSHMAGQTVLPVSPSDFLGVVPARPPRNVLNIGHKGAEGHIKGNTMESFYRAVDMGVDMIEFDVVACSDGIICHHDPMHEDSGRWYQNMTIFEIRSLLGYKHPSLDEMLKDKKLRDSGVHLYFDLKYTKIVRPTMRAIINAISKWGWSASRFTVATFKQIELLEINAFRRSIPELRDLRTAVILDAIPLSLAKEFEVLGCSAVSVGQHCVCPEFVADCHRRGLQMWAWTVNHRSMINELLRLGVDGICTDFPERITSALSARISASATQPVSLFNDETCEKSSSITLRLVNTIYGILGDARTPAVRAIVEAQVMVSILEKNLEAISLCAEEFETLKTVLMESELMARMVLHPYVISASTYKWIMGIIQSTEGQSAMKLVAKEIESPHNFLLLDFERQFLVSAWQSSMF